MKRPAQWSRREREMMDIIYREDEATAAEVREAMASPPSYSAVRATLRVLMEKGHLKHRREGARYVYRPTVPRDRAQRFALRHLLNTFFGGSTEGAVAALLDMGASRLSREDFDRLEKMVRKAKKEGR